MILESEGRSNHCIIKKGQLVHVTVKEHCSDLEQRGGNLLFNVESDKFSTMHAVIKTIYEALPEFKGKRIHIEVLNRTSGERVLGTHFVHRNRIPNQL